MHSKVHYPFFKAVTIRLRFIYLKLTYRFSDRVQAREGGGAEGAACVSRMEAANNVHQEA